MGIGKVINIASWVIDRYDDTKAWFKRWARKRQSKGIRKAVDDGDVEYINRLVRDLKRRRKDRHDAS